MLLLQLMSNWCQSKQHMAMCLNRKLVLSNSSSTYTGRLYGVAGKSHIMGTRALKEFEHHTLAHGETHHLGVMLSPDYHQQTASVH